ncbi:MAG: TolC family outer membrane protein [Methylococcales bacterium]|nr:TolC family outer membrane protein [Methylococcales bacterium]
MKKRFYTLLIALLPLSSVYADDLMTIYRQALYADPNLKTAQLQVGVGEAQHWQAGGELLPQVSVSANLSLIDQRNVKTKAEDSFKGERYTLNLTQSLIDVPKVLNWIRSNKVVDQYKQANVEAEQNLMLLTVERYFAVLAARDNLGLIENEVALSTRQLEQLTRQFEKQLVKITDVYEMEAKLDLLVADQVDAKTQLDVARQEVSELTGTVFDSLVGLRDTVDFVALSGTLDQRILQARELNAGLKAQEKAIEAADYAVSMEHSRHLPVVDLQFSYFRSNTGFNDTQSNETDTKVGSININIPLFPGGTTLARADEASKNREISRQKKIALLRGVIKETREAFLSTNASVRRIEAASKAVKSAIKANDAMQKGFRYGVQTIGDVLVSQQRVFEARKGLLDVRYVYITHWIRFQKITGVITMDSLATINQWLGKNVL